MKRVLAVILVFGVAAPAALASSGTLSVTKSAINPDSKVKVSGTVSGCKGPVTLESLAFASKHKTGRYPSVKTKVSGGRFSDRVKVKGTAAGKYKVSATCGGSKFASTNLKVSGSPGGGFYPPAGD